VPSLPAHSTSSACLFVAFENRIKEKSQGRARPAFSRWADFDQICFSLFFLFVRLLVCGFAEGD